MPDAVRCSMPSRASQRFSLLLESVDQLIKIHSSLTTATGHVQAGRGRRHKQDALHRAGVVMTVAAWESYVEEVAIESLAAIETTAGGAVIHPAAPMPAWARQIIALHRSSLTQILSRFNTPNAENVRDLFANAVGFDPWPTWTWRSRRRQWNELQTRTRLNHWLQVRHSIVHGFAMPNYDWLHDRHGQPKLNLRLLKECKRNFEHLVLTTDRSLENHLQVQHGIAAPWR